MESESMFRPVLVAWAQLQQESLGHKKCKRVGVGGLIRFLRAANAENTLGPYAGERRAATQLLESICRHCGKCKEWP